MNNLSPPRLDYPTLHAQVPAEGPRHPQRVWRGVIPGQSRAGWGRHRHFYLPGDRVHHCHRVPESTGTRRDTTQRKRDALAATQAPLCESLKTPLPR